MRSIILVYQMVTSDCVTKIYLGIKNKCFRGAVITQVFAIKSVSIIYISDFMH